MKHFEPAAAAARLLSKPTERPLDRGEVRRALRSEKGAVGSSSRGSLRAVPAATEPSPPSASTPRSGKALGLMSLIAATFFVVSGGPYGLEEIVGSHGYLRSLALLIVVPLVWSLPIALVVGEMSSTLPQEGGYYAWVRRAMGPFWGMQVAWLALAMSLFDMAIYPTLLITYLGRLLPVLQDTSIGGAGWVAGVVMIGLCTLWNLRGSRAVGEGSVVLGAVLLLPFVVLIGCALWKLRDFDWATTRALLTAVPPTPSSQSGGSPWVAGILLCMWNYMGWDNASTVAAEVERPQQNYPKAMVLTVLLVASCYILPVLFAALSGVPSSAWTAGAWVEVGRRLGGPWLAGALALGGALCGLGMFNVLVLSYSRLPLAMARDGLLPRWIGVRSRKTGAPRRAIILAAVLYAACLGLGFRRLVEIDVILYGAALLLQFGALIVLRVREPKLARPFLVPGGIVGLVVVAALPIGLLGLALWVGRQEPGMWGLSGLQLGALIALCGPLLYGLDRLWLRRHPKSHPASDDGDKAAEPIVLSL